MGIEMEEKKLTEEEWFEKVFVKTVELMEEFCKNRKELSKDIDIVGRTDNEEESVKFNRRVVNYVRSLQAEIERLTKEHERIAWSKQEYMDWVHGFLSTHTDMKDRGEKYEMFDRDWMCNVFWEKIVGTLEYIIDLEKQRNELQKQVDELTEQRDNQAYIAEELVQEKHRWTEQTVKDTAKDIYLWLQDKDKRGMTVPFNMVLRQLKERYGVEVE